MTQVTRAELRPVRPSLLSLLLVLALRGAAAADLAPPELHGLMPGVTVSHDATVLLDPATGELAASDTITLQPQPSDGVARFWLHPSLRVTRVTGGTPTRAGGRLDVLLTGGPLAIAWSGRLPAEDDQWIDRTGAFLQEEGRWHPNHYGLHGASTLRVEMPEAWVLASPAALDGRTLRFPEGTCGMALAAGPYRLTVDPPLRILTYGAPPPGLADEARRILRLLEERFGPFPADRLDLVESPGEFGGGLTGLVQLPSDVLTDPARLEDFLAHEISHTWWAGSVPAYSNDGLWYEALAEFSAGLVTGRIPDPDWPDGGLTPLREARSYEPWEEADLVAYQKGALFVAALRRRLGDEAFFAGLRRFARDRRGRLSGWTDLQRALARPDLDPLFDLWLDGRDLPGGEPAP